MTYVAAAAHGAHGARLCSKSGCSQRATATLTYQYRRSQVWVDELSAERDPHAYDLCDMHAAALSAPQGWWVNDRRHPHDERATLIA